MGMIVDSEPNKNMFIWFTGYPSNDRFIIKKEHINKITTCGDHAMLHTKQYEFEIAEDITTCMRRLEI